MAALAVLIGGCDLAAMPQQPGATGTVPASRPSDIQQRVAPDRNRVWFLTRDGVFSCDVTTPEKITAPLPAWQWVDAPYGCACRISRPVAEAKP